MTPKKSRQALGRGLSSLIPVIDPEDEIDNEVVEIAISRIAANPFQPRKAFHEEDIKDLADSIKSQGLLQPIVVRRKADGFEIVSGERRLRALKFLDYLKAPCIVKEQVSDTKMLEMALVENIQRENLNDMEIAESYQRLLLQCGLSHKELSERVGKSRSVITNTLRLLKLPEPIQVMVRDGAISSGHARAILSIDNTRSQHALAEKVVSNGLTVRDVERIAQQGMNRKKKKGAGIPKRRTTDPELLHQEDRLRYHFGTDVKIIHQNDTKGKIEIPYYTKEDLNRVLSILIP
jgi:ParB family chromosome partitioning protein